MLLERPEAEALVLVPGFVHIVKVLDNGPVNIGAGDPQPAHHVVVLAFPVGNVGRSGAAGVGGGVKGTGGRGNPGDSSGGGEGLLLLLPLLVIDLGKVGGVKGADHLSLLHQVGEDGLLLPVGCGGGLHRLLTGRSLCRGLRLRQGLLAVGVALHAKADARRHAKPQHTGQERSSV